MPTNEEIFKDIDLFNKSSIIAISSKLVDKGDLENLNKLYVLISNEIDKMALDDREEWEAFALLYSEYELRLMVSNLKRELKIHDNFEEEKDVPTYDWGEALDKDIPSQVTDKKLEKVKDDEVETVIVSPEYFKKEDDIRKEDDRYQFGCLIFLAVLILIIVFAPQYVSHTIGFILVLVLIIGLINSE